MHTPIVGAVAAAQAKLEASDDSGQALKKRYADIVAREATVARRERDLDTRESAFAERVAAVEALLEAADLRDDLAEFRDGAALHRDLAATISDFFSHEPSDIGALRAPGAAALDRTDARSDRVASRRDRTQVAEGGAVRAGRRRLDLLS